MNIIQILEAQYQTNFKSVSPKGRLDRFNQGGEARIRNLPQGYYSVVRPNKIDPHLVTKTSKRRYDSSESDSFGEFIKFIYDNGYQDNIHMPRVYNWKVLTDSDGNKIYKYDIEKLVNGKDIDPELMVRYIQSIIPESELRNYDIDYTILSDFVSNEIDNRQHVFISDELNQACAIVAEAIDSLGVERDTHFNNIMFRQNRYGIQLVFSDPVA